MKELKVICTGGRFAVVEMADGGVYHTKEAYELLVNGESRGKLDRVITPIYDLLPDQEYQVCVKLGEELAGETSFHTKKETVTLNVRQFGAAGDGVKDDTLAIHGMSLRRKGADPRRCLLVCVPVPEGWHFSGVGGRGGALRCDGPEPFPLLSGHDRPQ